MPLLLRRTTFAAVVLSGAALLGAGVYGVAGIDSELQVAAERIHDDGTMNVRYDDGAVNVRSDDGLNCPDAPDDPRV